ncbi:hypothetical protein CES85_3792 (plasmid) [Ochrobactrum quorumnocens]|uniref:Uncharacterized protein n=1 Tax=Ochrobactrum quorumnocens TaxID=271865 RepID=A0A248UMQ9_9HYPH|nr:hypothetical protein CES85_3792 [[Ochrobactrum] quorumnocens]
MDVAPQQIAVLHVYLRLVSRDIAFMKTICYLLASFGFGYFYYERYWRWHDCIAEASSSCLTEDGSNLTSGGQLWGIVAAVFLLFALRTILRSRKQ